ncbi:MAG: tetratricopeptide repeat protein, partial [Tepidisphaeraceae bacterium]
MRCWTTWPVWLSVFVLLLAAGSRAVAQPPSSPLGRAVELMKNRQYNDAIHILRDDIKGKPEADVARQMLMLGECYYVSKAYDEARPMFLKASRNLTEEKDKILAEYRLACTHFRLKDYAGAGEKIDGFIGRYPGDPHAGTLLLFKMLILGEQGAKAEGAKGDILLFLLQATRNADNMRAWRERRGHRWAGCVTTCSIEATGGNESFT